MRNMHDYPAEIERLALELAANGDGLSEVRGRIKDAEMKATSAATSARGENNKPLHTNDKARELAAFFPGHRGGLLSEVNLALKVLPMYPQ